MEPPHTLWYGGPLGHGCPNQPPARGGTPPTARNTNENKQATNKQRNKTNQQRNKQANNLPNKETKKYQANKQTDTQTNKQADKQARKQTSKHKMASQTSRTARKQAKIEASRRYTETHELSALDPDRSRLPVTPSVSLRSSLKQSRDGPADLILTVLWTSFRTSFFEVSILWLWYYLRLEVSLAGFRSQPTL